MIVARFLGSLLALIGMAGIVGVCVGVAVRAARMVMTW